MNFILENWYWVAAALISGAALLRPQWARTGSANGIGTPEAVQLINREKAVLIDVREAADFASGHAVGARNVPASALAGHKALPSNKTLPVILMCGNGSAAAKAVAGVVAAGHQRVYALTGGLAAWREAQFPIESA